MKSHPGLRPAPSILIVEDEQKAIEFLSRMVAKRYPDYLILLAQNGQRGLKLFQEHGPDLVVTDISMPVMDGIEMAGKIKALDAGAHIITTTATSETHYLLDAIKIGINGYVLKPIDLDKLFEAMDECLDRKALNRQINAQNDLIRKLSRAVEQSTNMIMIADACGTIEYVNPTFSAITGYTPEEVSGQSFRVLLPPESYEMLRSAVSRGLEWRGEFANRKKSGELFCVEASISTLAAGDGCPSHLVAVLQDISERKQAQENIRRINGELEQRVKERTVDLETSNKELESFCYSVSHDLRAPLRGMGGFSDILQEDYADCLDETGKECLHRIKSAAVTMGQLIDDLLNLSRVTRSQLRRGKVNLSAMANHIIQAMTADEPERQVEVIVSEGIEADGDPNLIRLMLDNLLGNAWKYTGNETQPKIEFGLCLINGKPVYFVQDNGIGFDVAHAAMLFKPFHRLRGVVEFEGHGIGLATVQRIVSRHGGQIWAEGEVGNGAKFLFTLG